MKHVILPLILLASSVQSEALQGSRDIVFALQVDASLLAKELNARLPDNKKTGLVRQEDMSSC